MPECSCRASRDYFRAIPPQPFLVPLPVRFNTRKREEKPKKDKKMFFPGALNFHEIIARQLFYRFRKKHGKIITCHYMTGHVW